MPCLHRQKARLRDLTAGCKTVFSGPAPWRESPPWKTHGPFCVKKSTVTIINRFIQPQEKCQLSDLLMLKRLEIACSDRLFYRNPTSRPRMSSACGLLVLWMAIAESLLTVIQLKCQRWISGKMWI